VSAGSSAPSVLSSATDDQRSLTLAAAVAPIVWGTTYLVTSQFLPPGRPMAASVLRAIPAGLLLLALAPGLPPAGWRLKTYALAMWVRVGACGIPGRAAQGSTGHRTGERRRRGARQGAQRLTARRSPTTLPQMLPFFSTTSTRAWPRGCATCSSPMPARQMSPARMWTTCSIPATR